MAYRTFGEIKTFAMDMLSENELDTVFRQSLLPRWATRTRDRINQWHAWMWKEGLIRLTWPGQPDRSVSAILYLPEDVDQILSMYPNRISYREPVQILERWEFDQSRPGNTIGRGRDYLVLWGYYGVKLDNPATSVADVVATGGVNAEGVRCRITGRDEGNDFAQEVVTLDASGLATTATTWLGGVGQDGIVRFEIDGSSLVGKTDVGIITLENSGIELESLKADFGELSKERRRTELYAQIGAAGTYDVAYYRRLKPLRADSDAFLPELPNEFADIAEFGIMSMISHFRKEWDSKSENEREFMQRMRELVAWTNRKPGQKRRFTTNRQWGSRTARR